MSPRNHVLDRESRSPRGKDTFEVGRAPTNCDVTAAGECACTAQAAEECIHCHETAWPRWKLV